MERLIKISKKRIGNVSSDFTRYLYNEIDWGQPLSIITGARGTGKTTLLLQRAKKEKKASIYLSLDDIYFESHRIVHVVEDLYESGYRYFFLDEVHQYEYWSKDLKNLYDSYPDIKVVATGSSILQIDKGRSDLSRRAETYELAGLSFREYLKLDFNIDIKPIALDEILKEHVELAAEISDRVDFPKMFQSYLEQGYYPFFKTNRKSYHQKLQQVVQLVMETDIAFYENLASPTVKSMRKLLYIISQSAPFTPNIQKISSRIGIPRNSTLRILDLLEKGKAINLLKSGNKGVSYLQKPEKIYLQNTNLAYTFSDGKPDRGNLRETFFFNQLQAVHKITSSKYGDFMVDGKFTFEIGGPSKTAKQIIGVPQAYIVADGIKGGRSNKIPLWLFGFLY